MEERIFGLIEHLAIELEEMKQYMDENMATKQDIDRVEISLREEIVRVETSLREDIDRLSEHIDRVETSLREDIDRLSEHIDRVETSLREDIDRLSEDIVRVEHEVKQQRSLFDGYLLTSERLDRVENRLDKLTDVVERHELKLANL